MSKYTLSGKEYGAKETLFQEKLGITESDFETYRKIERYFYILDAFCWCSDNDYPCSDELAEAMADYVIDNHDSDMSHWDNFETAYNACAEPDTEPDEDMQFAGDIYGYDDVDNDIYGGESLE